MTLSRWRGEGDQVGQVSRGGVLGEAPFCKSGHEFQCSYTENGPGELIQPNPQSVGAKK
jgi:hypothetical protein